MSLHQIHADKVITVGSRCMLMEQSYNKGQWPREGKMKRCHASSCRKWMYQIHVMTGELRRNTLGRKAREDERKEIENSSVGGGGVNKQQWIKRGEKEEEKHKKEKTE